MMLRLQNERTGAAVTLSVEGPIQVGETAALLRREVGRLLATGTRNLILDLSAVNALDAGGLGALLDIRRAVEDAGAAMTILRPSARVRRLLALCRLSGAFVVTETEAPATGTIPGGSRSVSEAVISVLDRSDAWAAALQIL